MSAAPFQVVTLRTGATQRLGQWQLTTAKRQPGDAPPAPPQGAALHAVFRHRDGVHVRDGFVGFGIPDILRTP